MSLWIDQKYANMVGNRLDRFKRKNANLFNFRCPICGDSKVNTYKARAFLYASKQSLYFKCHNCHVSCTFENFLETIDPNLANEYRLEKFREKSIVNAPRIEVIEEEQKLSTAISEEDFLQKTGARKLENLPKKDAFVLYVQNRKIPIEKYKELYAITDMREILNVAPQYEGRLIYEQRLLIPSFNREGKLVGVCGRAIIPTNPKRYIHIRFSDETMVYGLNRINAFEQVYVLEGQFDAMFIPNSIGAGGSSMEEAASLFPNSVLVYDNQPRNPDIVKIMYKNSLSYPMVLWPKDWKYKDVNEAIIDNVDPNEIQQILYKNTFSGLELNLKLAEWKRI